MSWFGINEKQADKDMKTIEKNAKLNARLEDIKEDIEENPYSPTFKGEKLKYKDNDEYSKRLTQKDRVVYVPGADKNTGEKTVTYKSFLGHYDDH